MSNKEYAKLFRWYPVPATNKVYGLRATMKLPTTASFGNPLGNGFINFYLAGDGHDQDGTKYHYECGISKDVPSSYTFPYAWRWFWTTPNHGHDGGDPEFLPGATVQVELSLNITTKKIEYKVNGVVKRVFVGNNKPFDHMTGTRLVVATCDSAFLTEPPANTTLPNWVAKHSTVNITNIQYRNAAGVWNNFTTTPDGEVYWPKLSNGVSPPHQGKPLKYTTSHSSGTLNATLMP